MKNVLLCDSCSLRVRVTNRAAIALYNDVLGYEIMDTEKSYYADGEEAYDMKLTFDQPLRDTESTADEACASGSTMYNMAESNHKHAPGGGCCGGGAEVECAASKKKKGKARGKVIEEEVKVETTAETEESKEAAEKRAEKNRKKREKEKAKKAAAKAAE